MKKYIIAIGALVALAIPTAAMAAVTLNSDGTGFVGKGDVQTLFGWNNQMLQKNAESLVFTTKEPASQALSQIATQAATQAATQSVSQDVTCTVETGKKTFHRDGLRDGSRVGSRDGSRSGSRAGALNGNISYDVDYTARKSNQFTGFILKGQKTSPSFAASGAPVLGDTSFGDWSFGAWSLGDTAWGGWDAAPGENPAECLGGNPGVTDLVNTVTYGDLVPGDITADAVAYEGIEYGAVSSTGPATLFVNGHSLPITPTAVPVA
jgi:hypothetical protein